MLHVAGGVEMFRLVMASWSPRDSQCRVLRKILTSAKDSDFGREHKFQEILAARNDEVMLRLFRHNVKPSEYEDFRPYVNRMRQGAKNVLFEGKPELYATTSGSTGEPKWIPVSQKYLKEVYGRLSRLMLFSFIRHRTFLLRGSVLAIVGKYVEGYTADGTVFGSVSAFTQRKAPWFVRRRFACPVHVNDIEDYTARNYALLRFSLEHSVTYLVSPNPSTLLELQHCLDEWFEEIVTDIEKGTLTQKVDIRQSIRDSLAPDLKPNPRRAAELRRLKEEHGTLLPKHFWPDLQVLSTWKCGNTKVYLRKLEGSFPERTYHQELGYFSSECRAGMSLDETNESVVFPHLHFYEFKDADTLDRPDAPFLMLDELQPGRRYCPYVTTFSGLYRYNMNDIVEASQPLIGNTPRIHMEQKVNGIVTITGEKLYEGQFIDAVNRTVEETGWRLNYFTGYANVEASRYDWYFEFEDRSTTQEQAETFARRLDDNIKTINIEYKAKRESFRLKDPSVYLLEHNSFDKFKKKILDKTRRDASRFKPNVLAQNEERHKVIKRFVLKKNKNQ